MITNSITIDLNYLIITSFYFHVVNVDDIHLSIETSKGFPHPCTLSNKVTVLFQPV